MTQRTPPASAWPAQVVADYRRRGVWRGLTLVDALRDVARRTPDAVAIVCGSRRRTYGQLIERIDRQAAGWRRLGFAAGDRVVLHMPNVLEFFEVCGALWTVGVVPVLALPGHRHAELLHFVRQVGARAYVTAPQRGLDVVELAQIVAREAGGLDAVVLPEFTDMVRPPADPATTYVTLAELDGPPEPHRASPDAASVALFQLSGGSTGTPKLIARTHDDYLYSVLQSNAVCRFDASTVYLAALPVAHNFPLSSPGTLGTLVAGGRVVLAPAASPDVTFPLIADERVTVTAVVPPLLSVWLAAGRRDATPLRGLTTLQVGGARLDPELARQVPEVLGCALQQVYGMAEGLVCYTRPGDPPEVVFTTQGRPMSPEDEVRIVDEDDQELGPGQVGELLTRGPYTIRGYFEAPEHNAVAFTRDGFYRTGDLATRTADGHVVVQGRVKDQVQRAGEKIAAPEVEAYLCRHPDVLQAAVVAVPDRFLGERACAFLVTRGGCPTRAEIRALFTTLGVAEHKIPDRIVAVPELPTTRVGKVDKRRLQALATSESPKTP